MSDAETETKELKMFVGLRFMAKASMCSLLNFEECVVRVHAEENRNVQLVKLAA